MVCTGSGKSERDRLRFGKRSGFGMSLVSRGRLRGVGMFCVLMVYCGLNN